MLFGLLRIDPEAATVSWAGEGVVLRPMEYRLLLHLASNPDRAHTREELLRAVWASTPQHGTRTVDTHITRLRRALPGAAVAIRSIRRIGYRFDTERLKVS